jgi:hypothetical protein
MFIAEPGRDYGRSSAPPKGRLGFNGGRGVDFSGLGGLRADMTEDRLETANKTRAGQSTSRPTVLAGCPGKSEK